MQQMFNGIDIFVTIAGKTYLPSDLGLSKLEVTDEDEGDSSVELTCVDNDFSIVDSPTIKVGALISVKWGFVNGPQSQERSGYVLMKPAVQYSQDGVETTLKAYTKSATLAARRPQKVYGETSVRQVVSEIVQRNGLQLDIEGGNEKLPAFAMANWTDRQTLRVLADRYGYQLTFTSSTVTFKPVDYGAVPTIELIFGRSEPGNIVSAELNVDAHKSQGDASTMASAVDPETKTTQTATSTPPDKELAISGEDGHSWLTEATSSFLNTATQVMPGVSEISKNMDSQAAAILQQMSSPDAANLLAQANGENHKKQKKKGELTIESEGVLTATCRKIVHVRGLAKRDSGNWYTQSVSHVIENGAGYMCKWELTRHGNNTKTGTPNEAPVNNQQPSASAEEPTVTVDAESGDQQ